MSKNKELFSWIRTILLAVIIAFLIRAFLFSNYIVEGDSMLSTMHDGDRLIVNKFGYHLFEPERFDIIVFHVGRNVDYIKRVIGLPGDHIEYKDDILYINGEPFDEPYLEDYRPQPRQGPFTEDFKIEEIIGQQTVPENTVFVLGDNRLNSTDSRTIGVIPFDDIVGEVNIKYWPVTDFHFYH